MSQVTWEECKPVEKKVPMAVAHMDCVPVPVLILIVILILILIVSPTLLLIHILIAILIITQHSYPDHHILHPSFIVDKN